MSTSAQIPTSLLYGGIRDMKASRHWRPLDDNFSLLGTAKKIIVLPGNDSTTPKQANGMCKIAADLLPTGTYQICGFYYSDQNRTPQSVDERATQLLDYFIPLFAKKDKAGNWQRLEAEAAAKNMRNITIITHCYGSRIATALGKKIHKLMKQIGYSAKETDFIERQIFAVHHNTPEENFGLDKYCFSNLYRITKADERLKKTKYAEGGFYPYLSKENMAADEVLLAPLSENVEVSLVPRVATNGISEHSGAYWADNNQKTLAGKLEEKICRAIIKSIVSTKHLIENMQQIIEATFNGTSELSAKKTEVIEYGQEFADGYFDYAQENGASNQIYNTIDIVKMKMMSDFMSKK